ncbi:MAG: DUF998 domain-containing protein [Gemmatimonadales bacterium]
MKAARGPRLRTLALCGVAAPLVYTIGALAAGAGSPGYSHMKQFVSELGSTGAPTALLMNATFLIFGLLMAVFALGLHRDIQAGPGDWLGIALIIGYGLFYAALAFAPCDPGCRGDPGSFHHRAHFLLSDSIVFVAIASPLVLYGRLKRDSRWTDVASLVLLAAFAAWALFAIPVLGLTGPVKQRVWLLLIFVWIETLALRLLRLSKRDLPGG